MTEIKNSRFIQALARKPVDMTPVWIMRQAGRYLPEYQALRTRAKSFLNLCKTPDLACEATLQPIKRYDLDAAIIFSDILTIPDALGLGLSFENNEGPRFHRKIQCLKDITALPPLNLAELNYVMEAIKLAKQALGGKVPLIGFSGSPWTLATYMLEGGSSKQFNAIKKFRYQEENALKLLLAKLTQAVSLYLEAQIQAGADVLMLFDTWGGLLSPDDYSNFSLASMTEIIQFIKCRYEAIPILLFTKNGGQWLEKIVTSGADGIGLDWTTDIKEARKRIQNRAAIQGNLDPAVLYASPSRIVEEVKKILQAVGSNNGHIFNLGHGISPDVPPEHVKVLVDAVHELSRKFHLEGIETC